MEATAVVLSVQSLLLIVGSVLFWNMLQQMKALSGTIGAQAKSIEAMKAVADTMKGLVEAADTPKMLERFKAYRELVDHEVEAREKQTQSNRMTGVVALSNVTARFWSVAANLMPYVPPANREAALQPLRMMVGTDPALATQEEAIMRHWRESLLRIAAEAPHLTGLASLLPATRLGDLRLVATAEVRPTPPSGP